MGFFIGVPRMTNNLTVKVRYWIVVKQPIAKSKDVHRDVQLVCGQASSEGSRRQFSAPQYEPHGKLNFFAVVAQVIELKIESRKTS